MQKKVEIEIIPKSSVNNIINDHIKMQRLCNLMLIVLIMLLSLLFWVFFNSNF